MSDDELAETGAIAVSSLDGILIRDDVPLYRQIADVLRSSISSDAFKHGGQLPTEEELSRHFAVSRITVRHALRLIEEDGLIRKRRAKSPEVLPAWMRKRGLWNVGSIEDIGMMTEHGVMELISYDRVRSVSAARALKRPDDEEVYCLKNVVKVDDQPFGYNRIFFPLDIGSKLHQADFSDFAVYRNLERVLLLKISDVEVNARAASASSQLERDLKCKRGDPIMTLSLIFVDSTQRPVQYSVNQYRGEDFVLSYRFRRSLGPSA